MVISVNRKKGPIPDQESNIENQRNETNKETLTKRDNKGEEQLAPHDQ